MLFNAAMTAFQLEYDSRKFSLYDLRIEYDSRTCFQQLCKGFFLEKIYISLYFMPSFAIILDCYKVANILLLFREI